MEYSDSQHCASHVVWSLLNLLEAQFLTCRMELPTLPSLLKGNHDHVPKRALSDAQTYIRFGYSTIRIICARNSLITDAFLRCRL